MERREFIKMAASEVAVASLPSVIFAKAGHKGNPTTHMVKVSDGCRLVTDVWLPPGGGSWPVAFTRTPYNRKGQGGPKLAQRYVNWGYAYVKQSCRGQFGSEGTFYPLADEASDGTDSLDWIANQKWCNGRIAMVGLSYLGIVQVPAASSGHPALRCIVPAVAPASFFVDWIRYDGCFALANAVRWPLSNAFTVAKGGRRKFTWDQLYRQKSLDDVFKTCGLYSQALRDWVDHDRYDDYWRNIDQHRMYDKICVPGLHIGGWFDHLTRGQFDTYTGVQQRGATELARKSQRLLIGPWGHSGRGRAYGEWKFNAGAAVDIHAWQKRFVDVYMKDIDDGVSGEAQVKVFLMGADRWVHYEDWPPPEMKVRPWYLHSSGSANTDQRNGLLKMEPPVNSQPPDRYTYDPAEPVRSLGGPIYWGIKPAGPVDQKPILGRKDVLCYVSERLEYPVGICGPVELDLWVGSDAEDTDFIAKLCVVDREQKGRMFCLTYGSLRCRYRSSWAEPEPLERDEPTRIRIRMPPTAYVFPSASRIVVLVTSSSFPRILPHPNTMAATWKEEQPRPARQLVFHDSQHRSRLNLPVIPL